MTGESGSGPVDGFRLKFILSAGRTGTVFITDFLAGADPSLRVVHEPWPSRWEHVLANVRNSTGFGSGVVAGMFRKSRNSALARLEPGRRLIEINPLLCPLLDVVVANVQPLHVVHLVREPRAWATSISSFKASGWRRHFIDSTPFTKPFPSPRPAGWLRLSEVERELYRWRFCNEQILALVPRAARYTCLRYEDLFSDDDATRRSAFDALLGGLGVDAGERPLVPSVDTRLNASRPNADIGKQLTSERVREICGPLMRRWGYDQA